MFAGELKAHALQKAQCVLSFTRHRKNNVIGESFICVTEHKNRTYEKNPRDCFFRLGPTRNRSWFTRYRIYSVIGGWFTRHRT